MMAAITQDIAAQITAQYPAFAPLMKIPEISKLLIEASTPGAQWTTQKLQAAIQGTTWWKQTSQPGRTWQVTQLTDPASAAQIAAQTAVQVHELAATEGVVLTPEQVAFLTQDAQSNGWNAQQIQQAVGQNAQQQHLTAGTIQNTANQLGATAADYGIPLSSQTSFQWAQKIAEGTATPDGFTAYAQNQAKALYPHLGQQLDAGFTVRQIADPYMQIAAQTGVLNNPNEANLSDPKWSQALQSRDPKTGQVTGPMSLSDWQQHLMTDPGYGYDHTAQARDSATQLVQQLGQDFGVLK